MYHIVRRVAMGVIHFLYYCSRLRRNSLGRDTLRVGWKRGGRAQAESNTAVLWKCHRYQPSFRVYCHIICFTQAYLPLRIIVYVYPRRLLLLLFKNSVAQARLLQEDKRSQMHAYKKRKTLLARAYSRAGGSAAPQAPSQFRRK